jgi:hypothetical protein
VTVQSASDDLFAGGGPRAGAFAFDEDVAAVFDDMLERSIPFYCAQQELIRQLGASLWVPGSSVYDLGCSTGTTLVNLAAASLYGLSAEELTQDELDVADPDYEVLIGIRAEKPLAPA